MTGLEKFAKAFSGLEDQYVLIGGAAAELWFRRAGLDFRATKDLDLVLCVEALTGRFVERFWEFVEVGGYQVKQRSDGRPIKYRFTSPTRPEFPSVLELFAATSLAIQEAQVVVPVVLDTEHSSLSAILLDDAYQVVVMGCRELLEGVMCLTPQGLILLEARAWLDLVERAASGAAGDSKHIKKHRNDVFRIAVLLEEGAALEVPESVLGDLQRFLRSLEERRDEWPSIQSACRLLPLHDAGELLELIRSHFGLKTTAG